MANNSGNQATEADITLKSPVGAKPAVYKWPLTYVSKGQKIDGAEEIIDTIKWVSREYLEFKPAIENLLSDPLDLKSYDCIKNLCDKYNKITDYVIKLNKGTSIALKTSSRASQGLLKHIIQQVYNYAVVEPNELNKYSPFSSETYGETSFEFMAQLIEKNQFKPKEHDVFTDMGSGVGHIVLQMAATVKCKKCYGIEIADVPAGYAKLMEERFKFWMNWHGKTYTEFELFHGDFFEKQYSDIIKGSTYILVNNFAFKPDVDHKLKQKFLDLKDGAQILSSKPFCSPKSRVTERNLTDIGSMMHLVEIQPEQKKDTVSWTPKPLPYYLHVVDGSRIERYYERQKRRQGRSLADKGKPTKRRKTGKAGSDSFSDESDDNTVYGPTTRKAWSVWCNQTSVSASNRTSTDSGKTASSRSNSTDTETMYEDAIEEDGTANNNNMGTTTATANTNTTTTTTATKSKENDSHRREKRNTDTHKNSASSQDHADKSSSSQENSAQNKDSHNLNQPPKSCLDKKRDYAINKSGTSSFLQNAPPSALYSISKPADSSNGSSSNSKIPNIVIKVKPTIEAKLMNETATVTNTKAATTRSSTAAASGTLSKQQDIKPLNDENGKKLRQRKKSTTQQQKPEHSSNAKNSSKASESKNVPSANAGSNTTTNGSSRGKKTGPIASTASNKTSGRATKNSKNKTLSPDKTQSLDLLHAKTVESISGNAGYYSHPAPGCEDHSLKSIKETPSLPKVVIKDLSMFISSFLGPKNIEKFISSTNEEFEKFARKIQQPMARESLMRSIEQEKSRNSELHRAEEELVRDIKFLNDKIPRAMKVHCDELGIKNTPKSIVLHLGNLLKEHQKLTAYNYQLEAALQPSQRTMNPPAAHSNSNQGLPSPYRAASSAATLDLSLKQSS